MTDKKPEPFRLEVQLTKEHIRKGYRRSHTLDALALSVIDAVTMIMNRPRNSFKVHVTNRDILFIDGYLIDLPANAQDFLHKSDWDQPLKPMLFVLEIPKDLFNPRTHDKYE